MQSGARPCGRILGLGCAASAVRHHAASIAHDRAPSSPKYCAHARAAKGHFVQARIRCRSQADGFPTARRQITGSAAIDPVGGYSRSAMVEACVSAYAQTVAMCSGDHWRINGKGGRDRVKNSALSRILRRPNSYQSSSDFLLNVTRSLFLEGNAYALALRNDRFEIDELHLMDSRMCTPHVAETGDIFYRLGGNEVIARAMKTRGRSSSRSATCCISGLAHRSPLSAPAGRRIAARCCGRRHRRRRRDRAAADAVLHEPSAPFGGALDRSDARQGSSRNSSAIGGTSNRAGSIRARRRSSPPASKVLPWSTPGKDAAIAEVMKLSQERIALVFRVPLPVLGLGGPTFGSTEALMQFWIATGLGFALNHIEDRPSIYSSR